MALGFFRRWQKGIIIAIVVVMLIGFVFSGALQYFSRYTGGGDFARGETRFGALMHGAAQQAEKDLGDLSMFLNLGARSKEFLQLRSNGDNSSMAYAMLLQEAAASGYEVGEQEIDSYLKGIGLDVEKAEYSKIVRRVDRRKSGTTEPKLRASLARWLMVLRSYRAYQIAVPPSETALKRLFRDLNETLTLRIARVPADKYASDVLTPEAAQIESQFKKFSAANPGVHPTGESFGFGYAQPARAAVAYMLINSDVISRVTRPADRTVRQYYLANRGEFMKDVPVVPQPAPNPGATTKPDVVTKPVQMTMDEAWDQVVERLAGQAGQAKTEEFLAFVESVIDAQLKRTSADAELYKNVYARLIDKKQAEAATSKMIAAADIVALRGKTLEQAVSALAKAAGLKAICYPWAAEGEFSVSKDIIVPDTLQADGPRTLQAVLEGITRRVFAAAKESATTKPAGSDAVPAAQYPTLKWTACRGFAKTLFPTSASEGMTLLPMTVSRTGLLSKAELMEDKDIGMARTSFRSRGKALPDTAIKSKPLTRQQPMYTFSNMSIRRVLWQVVKAADAAVLKKPNEAVRKQVIKDCMIANAYRTLAMAAADKIAKRARGVGLEAAVKEAGIESSQAGPVARMVAVSPRQQEMRRYYDGAMNQIRSGGLPPGVDQMQYIQRILANAESIGMMYKPFAYVAPSIDGVQFKNADAAKRFVQRIFELVPKDIEKPIAPGTTGPVVTIPMPTDRAHYVVQRVGYTPAVVGDFQTAERGNLARQALENLKWEARGGFFGYASIVSRVDFKLPKQETEQD